MNEPEWIKSPKAGGCPVPNGHDVEIRYPDGEMIKTNKPERWDWSYQSLTHYRDWTAFYQQQEKKEPMATKSDGSTASYYELPEGSTELQHLISHRNMNYAIGSIFSLCYDHSKNAHSSIETAIDIRRMAEFEIKRLEEMQGMWN